MGRTDPDNIINMNGKLDITGATLVSVGKVSDAMHCKNVADFFGRPFYVAIPQQHSSGDPDKDELNCFVGGGYKPRQQLSHNDEEDLGYQSVRDEQETKCRFEDNNLYRKSNKLPYSIEPNMDRSPIIVQDSNIRQSIIKPPTMAKNIGLLVLHTPIDDVLIPKHIPLYTDTINYITSNHVMLSHRYFTVMVINPYDQPTKLPVFVSGSNCWTTGCPKLRHGDFAEIRNVYNYNNLIYKVQLTES